MTDHLLDSASMAPVLVHIPHGYGKPAGVWRLEHGKLICHYAIDAPLQDTVRARLTLAAKGTDIPYERWFRQLARRTPHLDDYEVIDAEPGEELTAVYQRALDAWTP